MYDVREAYTKYMTFTSVTVPTLTFMSEKRRIYSIQKVSGNFPSWSKQRRTWCSWQQLLKRSLAVPEPISEAVLYYFLRLFIASIWEPIFGFKTPHLLLSHFFFIFWVLWSWCMNDDSFLHEDFYSWHICVDGRIDIFVVYYFDYIFMNIFLTSVVALFNARKPPGWRAAKIARKCFRMRSEKKRFLEKATTNLQTFGRAHTSPTNDETKRK